MGQLLFVDEAPLRMQINKKLAESSLRIQDLEDQVNNYFTRDLPQYQAWVDKTYSETMLEVTQLEKKINRLSRQIEETLQLSMQTEVPPASLFDHLRKEGAFNEEECINSDVGTEEESAQMASSGPGKCANSANSRKLFRAIAKALHPDSLKRALSENEKNIWVKAQRAYAKNDLIELNRLEGLLRCSELGQSEKEPLSYSELIRQVDEFLLRLQSLSTEIEHLKRERAWNFCRRKDISTLKTELEAEFSSQIRDLKKRERELDKTVQAWTRDSELNEAVVAAPTKKRRKTSRAQSSLFDF